MWGGTNVELSMIKVWWREAQVPVLLVMVTSVAMLIAKWTMVRLATMLLRLDLLTLIFLTLLPNLVLG